MSGALYRKYRPKKFEDVIDQQHITSTIQNSIKDGTFTHAYLLTGPRGVGKTTVARLFAMAVNKLDYDEERSYSDIIEIDAASNRRIDEIRELREKINIAPSILKYKVYIIDEVHMLTREAFNALLKTLEEPPEHAIFILATTDFHKVPDTIISRCVCFSFSSISAQSTKKHLSYIADKEKIKIDEEAIALIADNAEGSFRDAISLLDQFRGGGESIKAEYVAQVLGLSPKESIKGLVETIRSGQPKALMAQLSAIRQSGSNDTVLTKQLTAYLRDGLTGKHETGLANTRIIRLMDALLKTSGYADTALALEIVLIEAAIESEQDNPKDTKSPDKEKPVIKTKKKEDKIPAVKISDDDQDLWQSVLARLKNTNSTLYGIARMAEPKYEGAKLELYFKFPFHYKQMNNEKNRMIIDKTVKEVDSDMDAVSINLARTEEAPVAENSESLKNVSNIFGSAEVIES